MAPVLSKEAVLCGSVDQLCLACESYLRSEREALRHVGTAGHRARWARTRYLQHYEPHRVRKVNKWYFCEFCNVILSTMASIGLHVEGDVHKKNKLSQSIERVDDVIICGDTTVQEEAWHGFLDENTCIICDTEYEDKHLHMNESTHVINLIHSKVSIVDSNMYRKIGDTNFHCLTCNEIVRDITAHLGDSKHKESLQQRNKKSPLQPKEAIENDNTDILDSITQFQKKGININLESGTAVCKKCSDHLEFNCKAIEKHIEEHECNVQTVSSAVKPISIDMGEKAKPRDNKTLFASPVGRNHIKNDSEIVEAKVMGTRKQAVRDTVRKTAEDHGLTYTNSDNKVHCPLCYKNVQSSVKEIIAHVNGRLHKNNGRLHRRPSDTKDNEVVRKMNVKKCNAEKKTMQKFTWNLTPIGSFEVLVNEKYCIFRDSFICIVPISRVSYRCELCDVTMAQRDIQEHLERDVWRHLLLLFNLPVVIYKDSEFIREVRPGAFHCGFCNVVIDTWDAVDEHLASSPHKQYKEIANAHASEYLALPQRERERLTECFEEAVKASLNML